MNYDTHVLEIKFEKIEKLKTVQFQIDHGHIVKKSVLSNVQYFIEIR